MSYGDYSKLMRHLENITDENNQLRADMEVLLQLKETPEPV
jgi:hypothetical protein